MLIKANAHRRDTEHAAVGVFALRLLVLFCVNGRGLEIVSAELCVVGVEDRLIPSGLRQRQAVAAGNEELGAKDVYDLSIEIGLVRFGYIDKGIN